MKQAHVFISGRVQGVFFRAHVKETADALGLKGWVKNLSDGRVEAVFCGNEDRVQVAIEKSREGSESSSVDNVEVKWEDPEKFDTFEVRR